MHPCPAPDYCPASRSGGLPSCLRAVTVALVYLSPAGSNLPYSYCVGQSGISSPEWVLSCLVASPLRAALPFPAHANESPGTAVIQFRGLRFICNETRKTSLTVWPSALRENIWLHFLCRRAYRSSNKQMPD